MGAQRGNETCRGSLLAISWKTSPPRNGVIGILAFEVANLMAKVVKLWQSLTDDIEILNLREKILNSSAIKNLVFLDDDYLITLAFLEIVGDLVYVAKSVSRLGKQCSNPVYHRLEQFFLDPVNNCAEWRGWEYRWKKMERKVKKMEKFMSLMLQFTQEQDVMLELEQTLRRMKANPSPDKAKLYQFRKKVARQRQALRNIRYFSPWSRSYDYVVRLLARSIFTILDKIIFLLEGKRSGFAPSSSESSGIYAILAVSYSKHGGIDALPFTVGDAALTLHYANVIVQVEKLAASPSQLVEERERLYGMLPTAIRAGLRGKLKKPTGAGEGSVGKILSWLSPIAHNTIKWYSNGSIEGRHEVFGKKVFLVQTLYFADQGKVERAVTELLVALNYHFRGGREPSRELCHCKRRT